MAPSPPTARFTFRKRHHLRKPAEFTAVYNAKATKRVGPLRVIAKPNSLSHNRIGFSVSKRVGNAVTRNRIKRKLREAFRLSQHQNPSGYDIVIVSAPHPHLSTAEYQQLLADAINQLHKLWQKRAANHTAAP